MLETRTAGVAGAAGAAIRPSAMACSRVTRRRPRFGLIRPSSHTRSYPAGGRMGCARTAAGAGFDAGTGGPTKGKGNLAVARRVYSVPDGETVCGPQRTGLSGVPTRYCALTADRPSQLEVGAGATVAATGACTAGVCGTKAATGAAGAAGPVIVAAAVMIGAATGSQTTGKPVSALMKVRPVVVISAQISARVTRRGPVSTGAGSGAATEAAMIGCGAGPQSIG